MTLPPLPNEQDTEGWAMPQAAPAFAVPVEPRSGVMGERAYMPASGTEGADFEAKWCHRCTRDVDAERGDGCLLLANAYGGIQPSEWTWWRGEPMCAAFEATDSADKPQLAGDAVADLFPGSPRRLSSGEQIRMLVGSIVAGGTSQ